MSATGHQIEESVEQLAAMIEGAQQMAEAGQIVELDVLDVLPGVVGFAVAGVVVVSCCFCQAVWAVATALLAVVRAVTWASAAVAAAW